MSLKTRPMYTIVPDAMTSRMLHTLPGQRNFDRHAVQAYHSITAKPPMKTTMLSSSRISRIALKLASLPRSPNSIWMATAQPIRTARMAMAAMRLER